MNPIHPAFATAALGAALAAAPADAAERAYPVADFDRIQIEGPFEVTLATGLSSRVRATGSAEALDRVSVGLDGKALRVEDVQLTADTAGTITLGSARSAKILATGPGDVTVGGSPACTVDNKGAGQVRCGS